MIEWVNKSMIESWPPTFWFKAQHALKTVSSAGARFDQAGNAQRW